jgi:hypothetical protein
MAQAAKGVIGFLDRRYSEDGTEVTPESLHQVSGSKVELFSAVKPAARAFTAPVKPKRQTRLFSTDRYRRLIA